MVSKKRERKIRKYVELEYKHNSPQYRNRKVFYLSRLLEGKNKSRKKFYGLLEELRREYIGKEYNKRK